MREVKDKLPVAFEAPGAQVLGADWGSMKACVMRFSKGTNFTPLLQGLKDDMCQSPHWGYLLRGVFHIQYKDGSEEVLRAGDMYYLPAGHTAWVEEDVETVEFSPTVELDQTLTHIRNQIGQ